jgi:hypothetical protein
MMIMDMDDIRLVAPGCQPVHRGNLEGKKTFGVIRIAIDLFAVQQPIDVYQVEIEPQLIGRLLDDGIIEPVIMEMCIPLVDYFPLIFTEEFCAIHRHDHFGDMP